MPFRRAEESIKETGFSDGGFITIHCMDAAAADLSRATAIFLYLLPEGILVMRDKLLEALRRGARIVSYGRSSPIILHYIYSIFD